MKRTRIRRISKKMIAQKREEIEARIALAERCGGKFVLDGSITGGKCVGGRCEICGKQMPKRPRSDFDILSPHEDPPRSRGGKVSLKDSKMICIICHMKAEHIKVAE